MSFRAAAVLANMRILTQELSDSEDEPVDSGYTGGSGFTKVFSHPKKRSKTRRIKRIVIDLVSESESEEEKENNVEEVEESIADILRHGDPLVCCGPFRMIRPIGADTAHCRYCGREEFHPDIREAPAACFATPPLSVSRKSPKRPLQEESTSVPQSV